MNTKVRLPSLLIFVLLVCVDSNQARAEIAAGAPVEITCSPAPEPHPSLKYRLVIPQTELVTGNAAIFYHRAIQLTMDRRSNAVAATGAHTKPPIIAAEDQVSQWIDGPIRDIPLDSAKATLDSYRFALHEVELGANRLTCDWEFDHRTEGFSLLLPDIQEMRSLARLVSLKARVALLERNIDEAVHWTRIGLVVGRHVSHGPFVIQALVGVFIDFTMVRCLEELIRTPGTPSLYWALVDRPRPFVDMRYPLEGERFLIAQELPVLKDVDGPPWSLEQARHFTDQLQHKLFSAVKAQGVPMSTPAMSAITTDFGRQLGIAAMAAKIYPAARRALIAQGRPQNQIDAMPVVQVALLHTLIEYANDIDDRYKWMNLPYWQSYNRVDRPRSQSATQIFKNPFLTIFESFTPALSAARLAAYRLDRQLDALQCIEAIRLYAHGHEGKPPATLEQMTETPVPIDPLTGKPFIYEENGNEAMLSAPSPPGGPDHSSYKINYMLKLVP